MYTHHRFDHEFPHGTPVRSAYVVCSVPRTGSSLLCELLTLSGVAGAPTEYFDAEQERRFREVWGCADPDAYVAELLRRKTSPNGVFGAKVHWGQMIDRFGATGFLGALAPGAFVHVRRRDAVAQAVSYVVAAQTDRWASTHDGRGAPRYDERALARRLDEVVADDAAWVRWFDRHRLAPLEVWYEDLAADPRASVARVLAHLGLDPGAAPDPDLATLQRQAGPESTAWAERFRASRRWRRDS